jgi:hypothetical protein
MQQQQPVSLYQLKTKNKSAVFFYFIITRWCQLILAKDKQLDS